MTPKYSFKDKHRLCLPGNTLGYLTSALMSLALAISPAVSARGVEGVMTENEKLFRKLDETTIAQFNVSFAVADSKTAASFKDKWRKLDGSSSASLGVKLEGLTESLMQRITNEAYADFRAKLVAADYKLQDMDLAEGVSDYTRDQITKARKPGIRENLSPYEAFGNVKSYAVAPEGMHVVPILQSMSSPGQSIFGLAGKEKKIRPITVNYLLHFGYIEQKQSKTENSFMNEVSLKSGVTFHEGMQIYWSSGVDVYKKHNKKGSIKIKDHIYVAEPVGKTEIIENSEFQGIYNSSAKMALKLTIDPAKYYEDAMDVLKRANSKLVEAMVSNR